MSVCALTSLLMFVALWGTFFMFSRSKTREIRRQAEGYQPTPAAYSAREEPLDIELLKICLRAAELANKLRDRAEPETAAVLERLSDFILKRMRLRDDSQKR